MPTTVNGIGTHYYGKKNVSARNGVCESCRRSGVLSSYDTRLWFVVIFIPVIPLGRKRIIDQCGSCSRHKVMAADQYEQARQLQISASQERFRREPTPEAGLAAHAQLLAFHEFDQAAEFRRKVLDRFPGHAPIRAGLAGHLDEVRIFDEAARLYEEAHAIQPELPEARIGVARRRMAEGQLDDARGLLDFLLKPGAGQHYWLGPLDQLAACYQTSGRHEDTLAIADHLLKELPDAGQRNGFRTFVRRSETALNRAESILPPVRHSLGGLFRSDGSPYGKGLRWAVIGGAAAVLLGGGLALNNEYIRRHRTLYVVNACLKPVEVSVDGGPPQTVGGLGRVTVAEGKHSVRLTGAVDETRDVEIGPSGYLDRWWGRPAWVLNAGGEAVLTEGQVVYSPNPPPPSEPRVMIGVPFVALTGVDYAFEEPPQSIKVERKDGTVVKTVLRWVQGQDDAAFGRLLETDRAGALAFAEKRLRRAPEQAALLRAYMAVAGNDDLPWVRTLLESGLMHRPISVVWHRAYQDVAMRSDGDPDLVKRYDDLLAATPNDGRLLYLRGRLEPDPDRQEDFFDRALKADPNLAWAWYAKGVGDAAAGRWSEAVEKLRKAQSFRPEEEIEDRLFVARLGAGEGESLVNELRARIALPGHELRAFTDLCNALAAVGKSGEMAGEAETWLAKVPPGERPSLEAPIRAIVAYFAGDAAACESVCRDAPTLAASPLRVQALLAMGRAREATADAAFEKLWEDPLLTLAASVGLGLEGRDDDAAAWADRASKSLETLGGKAERLLKLLAAKEAPSMAAIERAVIDPEMKALLLASLARQFPEKKDEYLAAARRFNILRKPPHLLVERAAAAAGSARP